MSPRHGIIMDNSALIVKTTYLSELTQIKSNIYFATHEAVQGLQTYIA